VHDPEVLILDEPTDGLDPNQKHEVRNLIKRMGEEKAIIFSTHILEEVEAACSRAIIIDRGTIIADGTPDELKARSKNAGSIMVRMQGLAGSGIEAELLKLADVDSVDVLDSDDDGLTARVKPRKGKRQELPSAIQQFASKKNLSIQELRIEEGRLDDLFREITKSDMDD
jgi:ABC-2 type transport system ATP-binding protein